MGKIGDCMPCHRQRSSPLRFVCEDFGGTFSIIYMGSFDSLIEVELPETPIQNVVRFKCNWFDYSDRGLHKDWRYGGYDPFVLAHQVEHVSALLYPDSKRSRVDCINVM
ncbi:hypothetical protein M9H77_31593 [Catharanthus roseus]|uniref:Uncharacterized protein n=1 Tax=Catharanthus roseus TaxID=4058 RepID=A0ACC0A4F0_CATRO|nr:hypothetical protein M9H77_31593 [Catharanthus roseus]